MTKIDGQIGYTADPEFVRPVKHEHEEKSFSMKTIKCIYFIDLYQFNALNNIL